MYKYLQITFTALLLNFMLLISHESKSIDTNFASYYVRFVEIANKCNLPIGNATIRIEMSSTISDKFIAECYYYENIIRVNKRIWEILPETNREQTLFHEMGHCLLNQRHDDDGLNLMNTIGFVPKEMYEANYDYFIRRLFKECTAPLYEKFEHEEIK